MSADTTSQQTSAEDAARRSSDIVPDSVIPHGRFPPLVYRDLPKPIRLRSMIGPSVILAGLALGSGEFIIWPYITYEAGFMFFWACLLGVTTQYFMNMEITRWALATGESAVTGLCRLSRHWAWLLLLFNIIPWLIPAWGVGAAQILGWLLWGPEFDSAGHLQTPYVTPMAIGSLVICGIILTAGPVLYETVERVQLLLVGLILVLIVVLAALLVRPDAVAAMAQGATTIQIPDNPHLPPALLLGALAFAGAGGTLNLGQSNYVKEKGYGMGHYIGRITSPITGKEEPVSEIGYHFPNTPENASRWHRWWRAANWEHFLSFFMTCLVCLVLLSLVSYSVFYNADGVRDSSHQYGHDMGFIWGQALAVEQSFGWFMRLSYLVVGIAILLTTEFGVLDAASRISTDLVKVNYLRDNTTWTESRIYYLFLWGTILAGSVFLAIVGAERIEGLTLFKITSSLNGVSMFLYSAGLLYLNRWRLPKNVRMSFPRMLMMCWAVLFFGFFTVWVGYTWISSLLAYFSGP